MGDLLETPVYITSLPDAGAEFQKGDESGGSDIINRPKKTLWNNVKVEIELIKNYYHGIFIRSSFPEDEFFTPSKSIIVEIKRIAVSDGTDIAVLGGIRTGADITINGKGGLDTGSFTDDQDYAIWLIYNPNTHKISCVFSLSYTSPTLPSGFTFKRLVGYVYVRAVSGSTQMPINQFIQRDNHLKFLSSKLNLLTLGSATSYTVIDATKKAGSNNIMRIGFFNGKLSSSTTSIVNHALHLQHDGINPGGDHEILRRNRGGGETMLMGRNFRFLMIDQSFKYKVLTNNDATIDLIGGILNI